jgi:hypothetical protein
MKDLLFVSLFLGFVLSALGVLCKSLPRWLAIPVQGFAFGGVALTAVCAVARFF